MITKTVEFNCDESLHMKAIAMLIQTASGYRSALYLSKGDRRANAKSLLGVMSLGIENGMEITVTAEGTDEEEAAAELVAYLKNPGAKLT